MFNVDIKFFNLFIYIYSDIIFLFLFLFFLFFFLYLNIMLLLNKSYFINNTIILQKNKFNFIIKFNNFLDFNKKKLLLFFY